MGGKMGFLSCNDLNAIWITSTTLEIKSKKRLVFGTKGANSR